MCNSFSGLTSHFVKSVKYFRLSCRQNFFFFFFEFWVLVSVCIPDPVIVGLPGVFVRCFSLRSGCRQSTQKSPYGKLCKLATVLGYSSQVIPSYSHIELLHFHPQCSRTSCKFHKMCKASVRLLGCFAGRNQTKLFCENSFNRLILLSP